jgi:HEPN domain-containing protein
MTNRTLAASYVTKARKRLKALAVLLDEEAYSDVIREAQEIVELALKAALRAIGVDPPKIHDVGRLVSEHAARFGEPVASVVPRLVRSRRGCARSGSSRSTATSISFRPSSTPPRRRSRRSTMRSSSSTRSEARGVARGAG